MTEIVGDQISLRTCPICRATFAVVGKAHGRKIYCSSDCRRKAEIRRREIKHQSQSPRSKPGRGKRRPLPDFARDAGWTLRSSVERLERVFADDRFPLHKDQVAASLRGHLKYAAEVCQDLLSQLDEIGD